MCVGERKSLCVCDARHERDPAIIACLLIDLYIYARACESVCERESVCICACGTRQNASLSLSTVFSLVSPFMYVRVRVWVRESLRVCVCVWHS